VIKFSKTIKTIAAIAALAAGLGQFSPAVAAPKTVVTIWSFGNVIRPELVKEYEAANPDVSIVVKKSELDPHHNSLITAMLAKNTPDIAAIEVSYSGYFRSYPKYFTDLKTLGANELEKDFLDWRWDQGVADNGAVIGIPTDVGGAAILSRFRLYGQPGISTSR
jgi:cellobiose transport system substrate-binding protein